MVGIPGQRLEQSRLEGLYRILWRKHHVIHRKIFTDIEIEVPEFNLDQDTKADPVLFQKLSLDQIISDYEFDTGMQLPSWLLPGGKDRLLVRMAYEELYLAIHSGEESRPGDVRRVRNEDGTVSLVTDRRIRQDMEKVFLIIGHPGIGKSLFLSYLLVKRLLLGQPTIFQVSERVDGVTDCTNVVHFLIDDCGVRPMDDPLFAEVSGNSNIWVLADQKPVGYPRQLHNHQWLLIVSSSPRVDNLKTLVKEYAPRQFVMSAWSWGEIVAASLMNGLPTERLEELYTLFNKYGPVARLLLLTLFPSKPPEDDYVRDNINTYERVLDAKIQNMLKGNPLKYSSTQFGNSDSHTIIMMHPLKNNKYKYISKDAVITIATPYIGHKIGLSSTKATKKGAQALYQFLLGQDATKAAAGWVFESRMHPVFELGGNFLLETIGGFSQAFRVNIKPGCRTFSKVSELGSLLRRHEGSPRFRDEFIGTYFKPERGNLTSVDSFVVITDFDAQAPRVVLFQFTIGGSHPVNASGLMSIWKELPAELNQLDPAVVFVIPEEQKTLFPRQPIIPSSENEDPCGRWPQYILGINDAKLWGLEAPSPETPRYDRLTTPQAEIISLRPLSSIASIAGRPASIIGRPITSVSQRPPTVSN
ncbi:hypothetical protein BZA77DRAFT_119709 [Pyronema omphalodes]|nr:hypothetical protein BZA77DRAFT_119709 [Pyronema omphalodes]